MHDEISTALRAASRVIEPYPDDRFSGQGIVICAGGARMFTCAWIVIGVLRRTLGCTLPIEVWYVGSSELSPPMRSLLEELDAQPVDATSVAKRRGADLLEGWPLKPFALLHSRFREILLIDADNVPVADPSFLFEHPHFTETGAVFWPDFVRLSRENPMWSIAGVPFRDIPSLESGAILLDKARAWPGLVLAHWMNQRAEFFYKFLYGDKDTFLFAWLMLGLPFHIVQYPPKRLPLTICQRGFDGSVIFQHRNEIKWVLFGNNRRVDGFRHEEACFALLDELRQKWDGRIYILPERSQIAHAVEAELIAARRFRFSRISIDERPIELLSGNRICGATDICGFCWHVETAAETPRLFFEAHGHPVSVMERGNDGVWRGAEIIGLQAVIEMVPERAPNRSSTTEDTGNPLTPLLEQVLDQYETAPRDADVMRDFVGTIRTLALMNTAVAGSLLARLDTSFEVTARSTLIRSALEGLSARNLLETGTLRPAIQPSDLTVLSRHYFRPGPEFSPIESTVSSCSGQTVLVLTPVKDASAYIDKYFEVLGRLDYPSELLSLGVLESDSRDDTMQKLVNVLPTLVKRYRRAMIWKKDFGLRLSEEPSFHSPVFQIPRRKILARARNHLLFRALTDEAWVLWLDVDVVDYPPDLIHRMIATGRDILHPHCVRQPGGPTFDRNAWRDNGRVHMDQLRGGSNLVRLDSVGGTVLFIRADLHRDGLIFPPFLYGQAHRAARRPGPWKTAGPGEIETEGLGLLASDMGHQCWGMPNLEVFHADGGQNPCNVKRRQ